MRETKIKNIIKRAGCLLTLTLVATLLCMHSSSSAKVHSGTWGKNTKWYYNTDTKTMTVDCKGRMKDDPGSGMGKMGTWYLKTKKIVFRKGVTYIGLGAFCDFRNVEEVILPEGLVTIGAWAFAGTSKLKEIPFPSTLKKIGEFAFDSSGLKKVSLKNVGEIGNDAFYGTKIKSLMITSKNKDIKDYAFGACSKLKNVKIENGIKTISKGIFQRAGMESITIPASVTKIGSRAFYTFSPEDGKLKSVTINSTKITKWGKDIFGKARKDLVIKVPKSKLKEYTKALRDGGLPEYVKVVAK